MKMLISGGCKNGKTLYAQKLTEKIAQDTQKYYVATMQPYDNEDKIRIKRHQAEREGCGFITLEQHRDIEKLCEICSPESTVLLDSTTALLMNEMFLPDGTINRDAHLQIIDGIVKFCRHVKNIAVVSDNIFSDAQRYEDLTEHYRYALACIDRALAKELDIVCEVALGQLVFHKGGNPL